MPPTRCNDIIKALEFASTFQGYGCSKDKPQAAHDDIAVWERN